MKAVLVFVLRSALGDSTGRGITSENKSIYLFSADSTIAEIREFYEKRINFIGVEINEHLTALRVVERSTPYTNYAEVVFKKAGSEGTYMAGGNYVTTSNSPYKDISGVPYPISVHDRFETWKENEALNH